MNNMNTYMGNVPTQFNTTNMYTTNMYTSANMFTTMNSKANKSIFIEKPINLNEYGKEVTNMFQNYRFDSLPKDKEKRTGTYKMLTLEDRHKVDETLKTKKQFFTEDIKGCIAEGTVEDYYHPLDSLNILKKNREIIDNVKSTQSDRQKHLLTMTLLDFSRKALESKVPKKMKITQIIPKLIVEPPVIEKDSQVKVNSKISQGILPKISMSKNSVAYVELFGNYVFNGSKNFPEGREQFTLSCDMFDVILFGGIITNNSHNLWNLDPSKKWFL